MIKFSHFRRQKRLSCSTPVKFKTKKTLFLVSLIFHSYHSLAKVLQIPFQTVSTTARQHQQNCKRCKIISPLPFAITSQFWTQMLTIHLSCSISHIKKISFFEMEQQRQKPKGSSLLLMEGRKQPDI